MEASLRSVPRALRLLLQRLRYELPYNFDPDRNFGLRQRRVPGVESFSLPIQSPVWRMAMGTMSLALPWCTSTSHMAVLQIKQWSSSTRLHMCAIRDCTTPASFAWNLPSLRAWHFETANST